VKSEESFPSFIPVETMNTAFSLSVVRLCVFPLPGGKFVHYCRQSTLAQLQGNDEKRTKREDKGRSAMCNIFWAKGIQQGGNPP
jgi:hypothetical protein